MLPSKDDEVLQATEERNSSLVHERNADLGARDGDGRLSFKEQAVRDLKPSSHRDT